MKFNEIVNILETYEEETRKGWYSYTFENGNVGFARLSNPEKRWRVDLKKNLVEEHLVPSEANPELYFWKTVDTDSTNFDFDADDYLMTEGIFHPYIAILHVQDSKSVLDKIKDTVWRYDDYLYCKRHGYPTEQKNFQFNEGIYDCAFAGIGSNERSAVQFYLNNSDTFICTTGYLAKENKHRRHFREQEWLFPYVSNGLSSDEILYIKTSSLSKCTGTALNVKKKEIISSLELLLSESGVSDFNFIEIHRPFKR